jgi:lysine-N-methylase
MTRFACLAERCDDVCCHDWSVEVDEASYARLRGVWTADDGGGRPFDELVVLNPRRRGPQDHAHLQVADTGRCALLEPSGLCGVHRRHGPSALSNACAQFPRSVHRFDAPTTTATRWELTGSLACPEAARLCLLAEDAVEWVPSEPSQFLRPEVARPSAGGTAQAREAFDPVRQLAASILRDDTWPWSTRLALLAHAADRLDPLLEAATHPNGGDTARRALATEIEQLGLLPAQLELHHWLISRAFFPGAAVSALSAWLVNRTTLRHGARFGALVAGLAATYGPDTNNSEVLGARFQVRRADLGFRFGVRLEQYFRNYALNFVMREPFIEQASLGEYVYGLLVRLGLLKHLLIGQPAVEPLTAQLGEPASQDELAALDRLAVQVFQAFARDVEHCPAFATLLGKRDQGGTLWGQSVLLAAL